MPCKSNMQRSICMGTSGRRRLAKARGDRPPSTVDFPAELATPRCRLRPLDERDTADVLRHFGDERVAEFLDQSRLRTIEEAREIVEWARRMREAGRGVRWALTAPDTGAFLGTAGFHAVVRPPVARAEIGFDLAPERWGEGLMREVLERVIGAGFDEAGLHRIEAHVTPGNVRSCRRLESLGFVREGVLREHSFWDGRHHDQVAYGLLAREWRARATPSP